MLSPYARDYIKKHHRDELRATKMCRWVGIGCIEKHAECRLLWNDRFEFSKISESVVALSTVLGVGRQPLISTRTRPLKYYL